MRKAVFLVFILALVSVVNADRIGVGYDSKTGDVELDLQLGELNVEANANLEDFKADIRASYGVDEKKSGYNAEGRKDAARRCLYGCEAVVCCKKTPRYRC